MEEFLGFPDEFEDVWTGDGGRGYRMGASYGCGAGTYGVCGGRVHVDSIGEFKGQRDERRAHVSACFSLPQERPRVNGCVSCLGAHFPHSLRNYVPPLWTSGACLAHAAYHKVVV